MGPRILWWFVLAAAPALSAARVLELRGHIDPAPQRAAVTLDGVTAAFTAFTTADSKGRFRFRKLAPGPYMLTVFAPGAGMVRRSIDVTPSLADSRGRMETTIPFSNPTSFGGRSPRARNTVSVGELAISDRARREFEEARKKLRKRDDAGAIEHLKRAAQLSPQYMLAWNELGSIQSRAHNWAEAETCFRKALALRPGALMPTLNLASVLVYSGKPKEALAYNLFAVERSPNNPLAHFQLGMNYYLLERDDDALEQLRLAKDLDPSYYAGPQLGLAEIYVRRGDRAGAVGELEDYLTRHPDAPNAAQVRQQIASLKR